MYTQVESSRFAGAPQTIVTGDGMEDAIEAAPAGPAVYAIWPAGGEVYLGRTAVFRRRLKRMMRSSLRTSALRIEYWPVGSSFEGGLVLYELAKQAFPDRYLDFLKLRLPYFLKLVLSNEYPRLTITRRVEGGAGQFFGPFCSRASAELFEHEFLDLFQMRRCWEDLDPDPGHPGCIYGEMGMCLRPCQAVVGTAEYSSEVSRVSHFLATTGRPALVQAGVDRDRFSEEMDFEGAARQHKRVEKIEKVLSLRDELAVDIDKLHGVAVTASAEPGQVRLWFLVKGAWQQPLSFFISEGNEKISMDGRLKELLARLVPETFPPRERGEHIAILARWFYSSWRDGEWVPFETLERAPFRKLVNAISRVARHAQK